MGFSEKMMGTVNYDKGELLRYKENPCGYSAIPLWKHKTMKLPTGIQVFHNKQWEALSSVEKEVYGETSTFFRLYHDLNSLDEFSLPRGFLYRDVSFEVDLKLIPGFIKACYKDLVLPRQQLLEYMNLDVFEPELWFWIMDEKEHRPAALCIADVDRGCGEGILEWIQVHPNYRGRGIGKSLVTKALSIMKKQCDFATVSGDEENESAPERLYRSCGFTGEDRWIIAKRR